MLWQGNRYCVGNMKQSEAYLDRTDGGVQYSWDDLELQ